MSDSSLAIKEAGGSEWECARTDRGDPARSAGSIGYPLNVVGIVFAAFRTGSACDDKCVDRTRSSAGRRSTCESDYAIGHEPIRSIRGNDLHLVVGDIGE